MRDARINMVYEGANGVQAMDLVGRKLGRKGGAAPMALFGALTGWIAEHEKTRRWRRIVKGVKRGLEALQAATMWLAQQRPEESQRCRRRRDRLSAPDGHHHAGLDVGARWRRWRKPSSRQGRATRVHKDKLMCARYWMERMVPECPMLLERIQAGSETVMEFE